MKITIDRTYLLKNDEIVTIVNYIPEYKNNMPYKSNLEYGNHTDDIEGFVFFNEQGVSNWNIEEGREFDIVRLITKEENPEYFL